MEIQYAYKVLRKGSLRSIYAPYPASVYYEPGRWVEASIWLARRGYHLMVFKTLEDARLFRSSGLHVIWLCEVEGVETGLPEICCMLGLYNGQLEPVGGFWPEGTIMARKVKLVKIVE